MFSARCILHRLQLNIGMNHYAIRAAMSRREPMSRACCAWRHCCTMLATVPSDTSSTIITSTNSESRTRISAERSLRPNSPTCSSNPSQSKRSASAAGRIRPSANRLADPSAEAGFPVGRRASRLAAKTAWNVQRHLHRRQHGFRAPRRLHDRLQHQGVRPESNPALHIFHVSRSDDPRAGTSDTD